MAISSACSLEPNSPGSRCEWPCSSVRRSKVHSRVGSRTTCASFRGRLLFASASIGLVMPLGGARWSIDRMPTVIGACSHTAPKPSFNSGSRPCVAFKSKSAYLTGSSRLVRVIHGRLPGGRFDHYRPIDQQPCAWPQYLRNLPLHSGWLTPLILNGRSDVRRPGGTDSTADFVAVNDDRPSCGIEPSSTTLPHLPEAAIDGVQYGSDHSTLSEFT